MTPRRDSLTIKASGCDNHQKSNDGWPINAENLLYLECLAQSISCNSLGLLVWSQRLKIFSNPFQSTQGYSRRFLRWWSYFVPDILCCGPNRTKETKCSLSCREIPSFAIGQCCMACMAHMSKNKFERRFRQMPPVPMSLGVCRLEQPASR